MAALDGLHGVRGAADRRLGNVARMGIARRLAGDGAEPETLIGVEARRLEPAIVEDQALGLRIFEVELAVVGALERLGDCDARSLLIEPGAFENGMGAIGHGDPTWRGELRGRSAVGRRPNR